MPLLLGRVWRLIEVAVSLTHFAWDRRQQWKCRLIKCDPPTPQPGGAAWIIMDHFSVSTVGDDVSKHKGQVVSDG